MIRAHRQPGVFFNKERLRIPADQVYHIESNWMDSQGNPLPTHRDWYEEFPDFEI